MTFYKNAYQIIRILTTFYKTSYGNCTRILMKILITLLIQFIRKLMSKFIWILMNFYKNSSKDIIKS